MEINVKKNREEFKKIAALVSDVHKGAMEKLLSYLEKSDFFAAPASTKFHLAIEGGLCQHSLDVYQNMIKLTGAFMPPEDEAEAVKLQDTCIICGLFHDLCKVNTYKPGTRNVKNEVTGEWEKAAVYTFEDSLCYGHGEGSVYMLQSFGFKLTREQALAIRWHMGGFDNAFRGGERGLSEALNKYPLVAIMHSADHMATYVTEHEA